MRIAFRYDNLPTKEKESKQKFGHYYDLSSVMPKEIIEECHVTYWEKRNDGKGTLNQRIMEDNLK